MSVKLLKLKSVDAVRLHFNMKMSDETRALDISFRSIPIENVKGVKANTKKQNPKKKICTSKLSSCTSTSKDPFCSRNAHVSKYQKFIINQETFPSKP